MAPSASLAPKQLLPAPSAPGKASQVEPAQTAAAQAAASKTPDTTTADAKPADAKAKPAKPAATVASADGAPEDTGTYPNINNVPKGETGQMSPEQRAALMRELAQARGGQKAAGAKPSGLTTVQQMRKLGNQHTKEALKTIVESE